MAAVYLREQGSVLRREGERLRVTKGDRELMAVPLVHVDQVVVMGNVQLTAPAVALLLQAEVDVVFMSAYGKFRGRLMHTGSKFAQLRHLQLQKMSDEKATLAIAKGVVSGKLRNQRALLQTQIQSKSSDSRRGQLEAAGRGIEAMLGRVSQAKSLDSLRGYEGKAGAFYFGALRELLEQDLGFKRRAYYPPPDPVNALLSFGYTLLLKDVMAAVQVVGLDPYLGFFHVIEYGRPSLALDMMEEFRPVIVDTLVLGIINNRQLTRDDFTQTGDEKRPVIMTERGCQLFIQCYEERVNSEVIYPLDGQNTTYRRSFERQVRQLARVIRGEKKRYQAMVVK